MTASRGIRPKRKLTALDMTPVEQEHVRAALDVLWMKLGSWKRVASALHFDPKALQNVSHHHRAATASIAFRTARLMGLKIDDLINGRFPGSGTCVECGHHEPANLARTST